MRRKIGVCFSVSGDARFLSHQDMMRLFTRAVRRAGLSLVYSAGYNPRPRLALALPRPVGVSCRGDVLVLDLAQDYPPAQLCSRLAAHLPDGISLVSAVNLDRPPRPQAAAYSLRISAPQPPDLSENISRLLQAERLEVERTSHKAGHARRLDIRPFLAEIRFSGDQLFFTLVHTDAGSARPAEVLALLGLDNPYNRSQLVRHSITYNHNTANAVVGQN